MSGTWYNTCPKCGGKKKGEAKQCLKCRLDKDVATRFWEKVNIAGTDDCWEWQAYKNNKGYGEMRVGDHSEFAHRFSWKLAFGDIPDGMCVLHKCDNASCTNPAHLFIGSIADNNADMKDKGRYVKGIAHGMAKLTASAVSAIRQSCERGAVSQFVLADKYGVTQQTISDIKNHRSWKWL